MISEEVISQLRRLMELREKRDEDAVKAKRSEIEYREIEADVFEALDLGPVDRLNNVDLGPPWGRVSFRTRETTYGRLIKGQEDLAEEYFREQGALDSVSTRKFQMKRINEIVRAADEQGEKMPPGLDFYKNRGVTITRQKN